MKNTTAQNALNKIKNAEAQRAWQAMSLAEREAKKLADLKAYAAWIKTDNLAHAWNVKNGLSQM